MIYYLTSLFKQKRQVLKGILGHTDIKITLNTYCDVFNEFESDYIIRANNYLSELGIKEG